MRRREIIEQYSHDIIGITISIDDVALYGTLWASVIDAEIVEEKEKEYEIELGIYVCHPLIENPGFHPAVFQTVKIPAEKLDDGTAYVKRSVLKRALMKAAINTENELREEARRVGSSSYTTEPTPITPEEIIEERLYEYSHLTPVDRLYYHEYESIFIQYITIEEIKEFRRNGTIPVLYGMEIETENFETSEEYDDEAGIYYDRCTRDLLDAAKVYAKNFLWAESDGSLENGTEFITMPFSRKWMEKHIWKFIELAKDMNFYEYESYNYSTTGLHIHFSIPNLNIWTDRGIIKIDEANKLRTQNLFAKFIVFCEAHTDELEKYHRRHYNSYCGRYDTAHIKDSRYFFVNATNGTTHLEYRAFKGGISPAYWYSAILFIDGILRTLKRGKIEDIFATPFKKITEKWEKTDISAHIGARFLEMRNTTGNIEELKKYIQRLYSRSTTKFTQLHAWKELAEADGALFIF